jgi:hypothetical protein
VLYEPADLSTRILEFRGTTHMYLMYLVASSAENVDCNIKTILDHIGMRMWIELS